jgi:hypothetical protein
MLLRISGTYNVLANLGFSQLQQNELYFECDTSVAPVTIIFPQISDFGGYLNTKIYVSDLSNNAFNNNITIIPSGGDTINQGGGVVIDINNGTFAFWIASTSQWIGLDSHTYTSTAYYTIEDEGTPEVQRTTMNFVGNGVTVSDVGGKTQIDIPIQPAYATIQEEGVALPQRSVIDFQGGGVTVTDNGTKTIVTVPYIPPSINYGLFAQTSNSLSVSGVLEQSIIGSGVGTLTVPANSFQVGDSFQASLDGLLSCVGSATLHIHVKTLGGVILADTGIIDMDTTTAKSWLLTLYFTIRNIGANTVASISSGGLFSYIKNAGTNFEGYVLSTINNTTFDTTIANTLVITAQWNTANVTNQILSRNFTLTKIY